MAGTIKQRSKGSWTIWWDEGRDPVTGKRRQRNKTIRGSKRDAERELRDIQSQLDKGSYVRPSKLTFGELLSRWLTD